MTVVVWIVEGSWPACVDSARQFAPPDADIVLLHVISEDLVAVTHGAYAGLFGRAAPRRDPAPEVERLATDSGAALLQAAAAKLGRRCRTVERVGHVQDEVLAQAQGATLLILVRDEEHLGTRPKSLGQVTRDVVDRAACPVLLVWPASSM